MSAEKIPNSMDPKIREVQSYFEQHRNDSLDEHHQRLKDFSLTVLQNTLQARILSANDQSVLANFLKQKEFALWSSEAKNQAEQAERIGQQVQKAKEIRSQTQTNIAATQNSITAIVTTTAGVDKEMSELHNAATRNNAASGENAAAASTLKSPIKDLEKDCEEGERKQKILNQHVEQLNQPSPRNPPLIPSPPSCSCLSYLCGAVQRTFKNALIIGGAGIGSAGVAGLATALTIKIPWVAGISAVSALVLGGLVSCSILSLKARYCDPPEASAALPLAQI